jgi:hypothetical protein
MNNFCSSCSLILFCAFPSRVYVGVYVGVSCIADVSEVDFIFTIPSPTKRVRE